MRGNFIFFRPGGRVTIGMSTKASWLLTTPPCIKDVTDMRAAQESERILFVADSGEVWLCKDRFVPEKKLLSKVGEAMQEVSIDL